MAKEEYDNLGEQEHKTVKSAIGAGKDALGKGKKAKDGIEKFIKIIKTLITHKGILIVLALAIFVIVFIVNAGAALYFLNWDTKNRTMTSKNKAFGTAVLERRNERRRPEVNLEMNQMMMKKQIQILYYI